MQKFAIVFIAALAVVGANAESVPEEFEGLQGKVSDAFKVRAKCIADKAGFAFTSLGDALNDLGEACKKHPALEKPVTHLLDIKSSVVTVANFIKKYVQTGKCKLEEVKEVATAVMKFFANIGVLASGGFDILYQLLDVDKFGELKNIAKVLADKIKGGYKTLKALKPEVMNCIKQKD